MSHKLCLISFVLLSLVGCARSSGPYEVPGYYQPAQAQSPYSQVGYFDELGDYHPPTQEEGSVMFGRWYRPQPGNPGPTPNQVHQAQTPYYSPYVEVSNMSSDGDVGTAY